MIVYRGKRDRGLYPAVALRSHERLETLRRPTDAESTESGMQPGRALVTEKEAKVVTESLLFGVTEKGPSSGVPCAYGLVASEENERFVGRPRDRF